MKEQLPDELLLTIFGNMSPQSLRDARLVNDQWNAISTPLVFERVHLSLLSWSLAKLSALSQSPLADHVKAIDFHTEKLYQIHPETYRKYSVDTRAPFSCHCNQLASSNQINFQHVNKSNPRGDYTQDQMDAGFEAYESCRGESDPRMRLEDSFPLLNECLPKFRNLREVVADRIKRSGVSRIDATAYWNNLKRTILINPFARSRHGDAVGGADGSAPTSLLLFALGHRSRVEGTEPVESLTVEMPGYSLFDFIRYKRALRGHSDDIECYDPDDAWGAQGQVVVDVFERPKHLTLMCRGAREMDKYELIEYRESEDETVRLLKSATNLESLELAIDESTRVLSGHHDLAIRDSPVDLVLSSLFSGAAYPFLRELKIGVSLHPESFINFLSWHKTTLRSLVMTDCIGYDWDKIWTSSIKTTRDAVDDHRCIDFSGAYDYEDDEGDDKDWEDDWHDDYLEIFQGKPLLFDVQLNQKMGLSYEEFEERSGSSRAAGWHSKLRIARANLCRMEDGSLKGSEVDDELDHHS